MSRWLILLVIVLVFDLMLVVNGTIPNKKTKKRPKKMKASEMAVKLVSLQKNVSTMWTEMKQMESSRVNVHVHGIGDDDAESHEGQDGTHVHIHMHIDDHHPPQHHGHHPPKHHDHHMMGHGDVPDGHTNHGFHGMPNMMAGGKQMMKFMHQHMHFPADENTYVYGHCEMAMNPSMKKKSPHAITGGIHLRQKMHGPLEIILHLRGFHVPKGAHENHNMHTHGFHVHEFGDLSKGCQSFGGHYNPDGVDHAGKDSHDRHAGDWGNIACDEEGEIHMNTNDTQVSLVGTHSILGRGIVIHETVDDLGMGGVMASKKTGNAGGRLACCVVSWAGEHDWDMLEKHQH